MDDFLSVPHDSGLDLPYYVAVFMAQIRYDSDINLFTIFINWWNGGSTRTYSLWLENGSRFIHAAGADSTDQQTANSANSAFTNNSWMHLVMLLDRYNGTIRAFKDKALVATVAFALLIQFLPQIRCFLGPARRPIPIKLH